MDWKYIDLVQFNRDAESAFLRVVSRMIADAGGGVPVKVILSDVSFLLDISPQTVKRYLVKHSSRFGSLVVSKGVVSLRGRRSVADEACFARLSALVEADDDDGLAGDDPSVEVDDSSACSSPLTVVNDAAGVSVTVVNDVARVGACGSRPGGGAGVTTGEQAAVEAQQGSERPARVFSREPEPGVGVGGPGSRPGGVVRQAGGDGSAGVRQAGGGGLCELCSVARFVFGGEAFCDGGLGDACLLCESGVFAVGSSGSRVIACPSSAGPGACDQVSGCAPIGAALASLPPSVVSGAGSDLGGAPRDFGPPAPELGEASRPESGAARSGAARRGACLDAERGGAIIGGLRGAPPPKLGGIRLGWAALPPWVVEAIWRFFAPPGSDGPDFSRSRKSTHTQNKVCPDDCGSDGL